MAKEITPTAEKITPAMEKIVPMAEKKIPAKGKITPAVEKITSPTEKFIGATLLKPWNSSAPRPYFLSSPDEAQPHDGPSPVPKPVQARNILLRGAGEGILCLLQ